MDTSEITAANNKFGIDLFKILFEESKGSNVFISPFSISVALAMTHLGAKEKTARDMAQSLRWSSPDIASKVHQQFQGYMSALMQGSQNYQLSTANRVYVERTFSVLKEFITATQKHYFAEPVSANFREDGDGEGQKINKWVEEQTHNKIKNLIPPGALTPLTRMVLVNAIYFKGKWAEQFDEEDTRPMPFKAAPGKTKDVQMMFLKKKFAYVEDEDLDCSVLSMPYQGEDLSMVIFLPREDFGLQNLVKKMTSEKLTSVISQIGRARKQEVEVYLPRFEIKSSHGLVPPLTAMGMGGAFDQNVADFSGMTGQKDLFISDVLHKAFIKVNEEGTEAAAATAVVMKSRSLVLMKAMVVDHPFLFAIVDKRPNGFLLFLGLVQEITQK